MSYTGAVCGKAIAGLAVCGTAPRETAQEFAGYQLRYGDYILYDPRGPMRWNCCAFRQHP